jgi:hypothetical protein
MSAFIYTLEHRDGTPADPPMFKTAVATWRPRDVIPLEPDRSLRVVAIRDDDADQPPTLLVEDMSGPTTSEGIV